MLRNRPPWSAAGSLPTSAGVISVENSVAPPVAPKKRRSFTRFAVSADRSDPWYAKRFESCTPWIGKPGKATSRLLRRVGIGEQLVEGAGRGDAVLVRELHVEPHVRIARDVAEAALVAQPLDEGSDRSAMPPCSAALRTFGEQRGHGGIHGRGLAVRARELEQVDLAHAARRAVRGRSPAGRTGSG